MVWLEALSYVITILGFPVAICVFVYEHGRRLSNEEKELHRHLSEEYDNFLRLVLDNADLLLLRRSKKPSSPSEEQSERRDIAGQPVGWGLRLTETNEFCEPNLP